MTRVKMVPPDLERCQAEQPRGNFMTLGGPHMVRCSERPVTIATEKAPPGGSMSLCAHCLDVLERQTPGVASFAPPPKPKRPKKKCHACEAMLDGMDRAFMLDHDPWCTRPRRA